MKKESNQSKKPLSEGQKALWLSHICAPGIGIYNNRFAWHIPDSVDVTVLKSCLDYVCNHHEAFRSLYKDVDGVPCCFVKDRLDLNFQTINLSSDSDAELIKELDKEVRVKFDLETQSAIRWKLYLKPNGKRVLAAVLQHINSDQWSLVTLFNQIKLVYAQLVQNQLPRLEDAALSFNDFMESQDEYINSSEGKKEVEYWLSELGDTEFNINLPHDNKNKVSKVATLGYVCEYIPDELVKRFNSVADKQQLSLFSLYFGLFQLLLGKYCHQEDVTVSTATAGRGDEFQGIFNYFVNPVISRIRIDPDLKLEEFFKAYNEKTLFNLSYGKIPFPLIYKKLRERNENVGTPFQANFFFHNINRFENKKDPLVTWHSDGKRIWHMGALGEWEHIPQAQQLDDFEITFKIYKLQNNFFIGIEYNTDLFKGTTIQRMAQHYMVLMGQVSRNSGKTVSELNVLSTPEKQTILKTWNKTKTRYNPSHSLPYFVEKYARSTPNAVAITFESRQVTYKELNDKSNQLANNLIGQGVAKDDIVGVYLDRSPDIIIALTGIMKAGAAYLPLDPEYPKERIDYILADAAPNMIVTQVSLMKNLGDTPVISLKDTAFLNSPATSSGVTLCPEQLAYIIYTSGSTGKPKGTMIEHGGFANLLKAKRAVYELSPEDRVLQFASMNFDASLSEIAAALEAGATLCMANKMEMLGENLLKTLRNNQITWAILPPALLAVLEPVDLPELRTLIVAGDACSAELARKWSEGRQFFNAYGPTETTIWATIAQVDGSTTPPIGKPIPNTQTYILDQLLNPVPIGVPGELHIGGDGLARGYLNRPDLTAEKFIPNPFSEQSGARLYKTGDLCCYLEDGNIEFLGRMDHQVKIRGFRVELGEIEAHIREFEGVHDVLVMARDDLPGRQKGDKQLVAYVVRKAKSAPDTEGLRAFLKGRLPAYMVPAACVMLDAFPLTPNEKIDRKALPMPEAEGQATQSRLPPRNEIERMIARVWQDCLGLKEVSVNENFFDLGGHSLLLAQVHGRLPEPLKKQLSMVDLFKYPTIQALAHFLEKDEEDDRVFLVQDNHADRLRLRRRLMESLGGVKIAIVGMAGRFPGAETVNEFWQNICDKKESITFYTPEQLRKAGVPEALIKHPDYIPAKGALSNIADFDAGFFNFTPREAQITDPQQRIFLENAWEALEDAGCVPSEFDGRIGVYAGIGMNQYLMSNLSSHPEVLAQMGDYPIMIGNDKDFLSTRVSYKLNLNGPAMVLQTACSTSLVAVHTACQALLNHDCDAALAGGVSFGRLGDNGYVYQPGMIMSADGHCRAFDADASGTVAGQGCGVVLLKRLDDALKNNDHIYAVISGSGTNNDGSNKTGYTAPSVEGQAKAISMAHASANLSPGEITYVETHGTGTPMGDPIEIEALRQAFLGGAAPRAKREAVTSGPHRCALGAVKTSIGHLDAASGVAGLIKTAKALEQKKLPPTLHFKTPNPKIDFSATPFYINTELQDWDNYGLPRYAAVSSFGIGGSNAHVVMAEAPNQSPSESERPWRIVTLSARTPSALEAMTQRLVGYLEAHREKSFDDMCYTLHVGRKVFSYRRYLVCRNPDEAIAELTAPASGKVISSLYQERAHKLVFLFSGQGSQYQNMGKILYQVEITFRKVVDECREKLRQKFIHIYEELTEEDYRASTEKIHQTYITQPGLFIFEYALARMLMSWGIKPDLMVGHSIGEYVAACLAGVFTLDQALELVTIRGHLIQGLESGEMLSVNLGEEEAQKLTNHDVSVAAVNGENRSVLSGTRKAIQYLHLLLNREGVENRILHTSHAFHSHMMEPILERFRGYVERRHPQPPNMPFVSSLTGEIVTPEMATSPQYWSDHLRHRVRFHKAMNTVFAQRQTLAEEASPEAKEPAPEAMIMLEVGPGRVLTTLVRQHPQKQPQDWILATTRHAYEEVSDIEHLLKVIARLWEQGVKIDWEVFHSYRQRYRVPMPTYPFERKSHWIASRHQAYSQFPEAHLETAAPEPEPEILLPAATVNGPRDAVESRIWQIWCQALGLQSLGINDDFFECGGDSLVAVGVADQIQQALNVPVASHLLIQYPSIAELADYVRNNRTEPLAPSPVADLRTVPEAGPLVVIQRGEPVRAGGGVPPLIMVHPIGGEVFFYRDLGRYLGKEQPLYAFQAPSLSGQCDPVASVPQLAELYVEALHKNGIQGPYYLGGSSFGGLVAYEMAQQLSGAGEEVRLLVMIDTPAPEQMPRDLTDSAAILHYLLEDKLVLSMERLRDLDERAQIGYVLEQARVQGKGHVLPPHLSVALFKTWMAHQQATVSYHPQAYHGKVLYFRHSEPMGNFPPSPHQPWQALVRGAFRVHQVPGNHISMNYPPHVQVLAAHLKPELEAARLAE